ncbi:hypothetical protein RR46_06384 [Papilio xuthus]|uniref:Uncharacterized protein n=1 Tax=Papilio xuthus TaxID=66420 RepID=A0A194QCF6_PAPXU|nr:hypothetical protein RR46_06384 [Papilio xuthus]
MKKARDCVRFEPRTPIAPRFELERREALQSLWPDVAALRAPLTRPKWARTDRRSPCANDTMSKLSFQRLTAFFTLCVMSRRRN